MDYVGLLTRLIKESGLTHEEIIRRCEAYTEPYNYNYISTIKNRAKIPSDDFSRAVAKVCGRHENLLIIQAYYDKSPQAFKDMFDSIIRIVKAINLMILSQKFDETTMNIAKKRLDEMAFSEWLEYDLSGIAEQTEDFFTNVTNVGEFVELISRLGVEEAENECSHIVPDHSMSPTLPEGAQINTELVALEHLKDGDFICFTKNDTDEIYVRKIEFWGDSREKMLLIPLNSNGYKTEQLETSNERLYEKVVRVVIDF